MEDKKYTCEKCKFSTNYKNVIDTHMSSKKHIEKHSTETAEKYSHICDKCNKTYSTHSGLWKHQKRCKEEEVNTQISALTPTTIDNTNTEESPKNTIELQQEESTEQSPVETDEDIQLKIKMNIIKILLDYVTREELNTIIDEIYDEK